MCNLPRCINDSLNNYRAISSFVPRWLGSFENSKGFRREICIRKLMGTRNRLSLASQIKRCSVLTRNRDDNLHTCRKKRTVIFRFHGKGVAAATLRADIFNGHAESRTLAFSFLSFPPSPPFLLFFPFIYRWYDHLRRDCVKWTLAPMPSFRSIEIRAFEKVRLINGASAKNLYFSFSRLIKTVEKSRKYLIFARAYNKKRERSVKRESARFLPIFRVYSSKKNLFLERFYKIFR